MPAIRILPDQVANRIAAGEVIERPVAVVKELVDNSIDASADRIKVQFKQGGKSYILVEDNGGGMSPDDALLSLERHATSKILSSDDLFNIRTLGFRGEAIPSIASVSRFLMRTRPASQLEGTEILVNGGKLIHRRDVGMPPGTRTEVTHLFNSIPARRKFLKTDNTEASHIIQWVRLIAVAHPGIAFRLLSGERTLLSVPIHEQPIERILALWGRELESQLLPIEFESSGLFASGFIGRAGVSRPSRQDIVTIVNGRPVESRTLGFAFTEAFHTHIPRGRYPLVFLQLTIDPAMVDVNIHPSKKEIKFKNESRLRSLVIQEVWKVLRSGSDPMQAKPEARTAPESSPLDPKPSNTDARNPGSAHSPQSPAPMPMRQHESSPSGGTRSVARALPTPSAPVPPPRHPSSPTAHAPASQQPLSLEREWRFIGDYHRSYSLFERPGGLSLLHNSRALRRIGYERVLQDLQSDASTVQHEILPTTLELEAFHSSRLKEWMPMLAQCGLLVEEFGRNFFRIVAVPAQLDGSEARSLIEQWLHQDPDASPDLAGFRAGIALLCGAKYRNQLELPLAREASMEVLRQLLQCEQPMVDPEGNAIIVHLPHRMFEGGTSVLGGGHPG